MSEQNKALPELPPSRMIGRNERGMIFGFTDEQMRDYARSAIASSEPGVTERVNAELDAWQADVEDAKKKQLPGKLTHYSIASVQKLIDDMRATLTDARPPTAATPGDFVKWYESSGVEHYGNFDACTAAYYAGRQSANLAEPATQPEQVREVDEAMVSRAYSAWINAKVEDPTDARKRLWFALKAALR